MVSYAASKHRPATHTRDASSRYTPNRNITRSQLFTTAVCVDRASVLFALYDDSSLYRTGRRSKFTVRIRQRRWPRFVDEISDAGVIRGDNPCCIGIVSLPKNNYSDLLAKKGIKNTMAWRGLSSERVNSTLRTGQVFTFCGKSI